MGFFDSLFGSKQQTSQSSQSTSNTQNNLWNNPFLQNYLGGYSQQYSQPMIQGVNAPANAFQYSAANSQLGAGANLQPGFNVATDIAYGGLSPTAYQPYMSQYTQQVVDPTIQSFAQLNQQNERGLRSRQAAQGALGNSTNANAYGQYLAQVMPQQQAAIAGLYDKGFESAQNRALQSMGIQLQGAQNLAQTQNALTQGNLGLNAIGEDIRKASLQSQLLPFQLYSQGLQGFQGFGNLAGSTTNSSGSSNSTTTSTPSVAQSIAGIAGMALGIPGMGGFGGNLGANLGMIPYGSFAHGGAVIPAYQNGGAPQEDVFSRFGKAFQAVQGLQNRASGGEVESAPSLGSFSYMEGELPDMGGWSGGWTPGSGPAFPAFEPQRSASAISQPPMPTPTQAGLAGMGAPGGEAGPIGPMGVGAPTGGGAPQMPPDASAGAGPGAPGGAGGPTQSDAPLGAAIQQGMVQMPQQVQPLDGWQNLAAMLLKASGPQVFGPAADAIYAKQKDKRDTYNAEMQAYEMAQRAKQWAASHGLQQSQLTETTRHNKVAETPEIVRQLEAAGLVQGTPEFQKAMMDILARKAAADKPQTALEVALAKGTAEDIQAREKAIADGQTKLQTMDMLEPLINNPNVYQGAWGDTVLALKKMGKPLADFIGVTPEALQGIDDSELLKTITNKYALSLRSTAGGEGMPGAMSDADRLFLMQSVPGLAITRAGNQAIMKLTREVEQYRAAANTAAQQYMRERNSNLGVGAYMSRWMQENPMSKVIPTHAQTRADAEAVMKSPETQQAMQAERAATQSGGALSKDKLMAMPDGERVKIGDAEYIKMGGQLVKSSGEAGTFGNPLRKRTDVTQGGQIVYENGKYYKRSPSMWGGWEEVQPPQVQGWRPPKSLRGDGTEVLP